MAIIYLELVTATPPPELVQFVTEVNHCGSSGGCDIKTSEYSTAAIASVSSAVALQVSIATQFAARVRVAVA